MEPQKTPNCQGNLEEKIAEFENKYRKLLDKYEEPLKLKHQIHIEIYIVKK